MKRFTETELAKELRQQYIKNPPEGMTSDEVLDMSDDDLLDMDYFLHEFDELDDDDFGEEGFISSKPKPSISRARFCAGYFHSKVRRK